MLRQKNWRKLICKRRETRVRPRADGGETPVRSAGSPPSVVAGSPPSVVAAVPPAWGQGIRLTMMLN